VAKVGKLQAHDFFAASDQNAQVEQELAAAQERIAELETLNQKLETLVGTQVSSVSATEVTVSINDLVRDPNQVRRWFDPDKLADLAATIKIVGFRGRLWVRPLPEGKYQLIAGERRLRAAIDAGLTEIPVDVLEIDDDLALTLSLVENLQREDLNPIEEADGILKLLARRLGKRVEEVPSLLYRIKHYKEEGIGGNVSPTEEFEVIESVFETLGRMSWQTFIRTRLSLCKLPPEILEALQQGKIEYTKAKAIAGVQDAEVRQTLLKEVIDSKLSLSEIQAKIHILKPKKAPSIKEQFKDVLKTHSKSWDDPKKVKKMQSLLEQLQALIAD